MLCLLVRAMWAGANPADPEALDFGERAVAIRTKRLAPDDPLLAESLADLGVLHMMRGEYALARPLCERALGIQQSDAASRDSMALADRFVMLATLYYDVGDYRASRDLFARVLEMRKAVWAPDGVEMSQALSDLGVLCWRMKDFGQARPLLERVLAIREKAYPSGSPWLAASLNNLAMLLHSEGDFGGAERLYERANAMREKALGPDHPRVAGGLGNLGDNLCAMGRCGEAKPMLERALAILEKSMGAEHRDTAGMLASYAEVCAMLGESGEAFEAARHAEEIRVNNVRLTVRTMTERQALLYASQYDDNSLAYILSLAAREPGLARPAWNALIQSRALIFDEMAARHRDVDTSADPAVSELAAHLAASRNRLSALLVQGPGRSGGAAFQAAVSAARSTKEAAEQALAEKSASFRKQLAERRAGLEQVSTSLPEGAALVAFARYRRYSFRAHQYNHSTVSYLAFALTRGRVEMVPLGAAESIDGLVSGWRREIAREASAPGIAARRNEESYRAAALRLREAVWDPVARRIGGAKAVYIVPDGSLHLVNFGALPAGGAGYLAEDGPLLRYLSTERDLAAPRNRPSGRGLLALGDPDFNRGAGGEEANASYRGSTSGCADFQSLHFDRLPASAREVRDVLAIWGRATHGGVSSRLGASASEEEFILEAPGRRVLHLATHSFFLPSACGVTAMSENPLLRAGFALAGANRRMPRGARSDGIMTAEEIASLDLRGVEWAVLSGCDTGLGELKDGEGVFGLRRAFQIAGVATVVMSLWLVEDESSREWMGSLYRRRFGQGLDTATAVRDAALNVLRGRRARGLSAHPFYWAAFIAVD